jgi:hypothetical protein
MRGLFYAKMVRIPSQPLRYMDKFTHKNESEADGIPSSLIQVRYETQLVLLIPFLCHKKIPRQARDFSWRDYWDDFRTYTNKI